MNQIYRKKYNKYKLKYIMLKNNMLKNNMLKNNMLENSIDQKGGYANLYIDRENEIFKKNNNYLGKYILLDTQRTESLSDIVEFYKKPMMDNFKDLFTMKNVKINVDLLNNFNRNIYVDGDNKYEIVNVGGIPQFKNNLHYTILRPLSVATGAGDIYLLEKNNELNNNLPDNLPDNLVLKIFKNEVNINEIKDYLSLEIVRISDDKADWKLQNNFTDLNSTKFKNIYNFNGIKLEDLFKTNAKSHQNLDANLYLSCKNDNFSNEIIVNLSIEKILNDYSQYIEKKKQEKKQENEQIGSEVIVDNFVKYYNYFITKYNGGYRYCILMEKLDGNLASLCDTINKINLNEDNLNKLFNIFYNNIIDQILPSLSLLKNKFNMFTHTDLKVENIFYKKIEVQNKDKLKIEITEGNTQIGLYDNKYFYMNDSYYKHYIADFDKSSITYRNLRFYNDFRKSRTKYTEILAGTILSDSQNYSDRYYNFELKEEIVNSENIGDYYSITRSILQVHTEQIAMRYSMFPFFLCFDIQSLILSLLVFMPKYDDKLYKDFFQFLAKYLGVNWRVISLTYREWRDFKSINKYGGDFGQLLSPLIVNSNESDPNKRKTFKLKKINQSDFDTKYENFINYVDTNKRTVNIILLTEKYRKLALTIPFIAARSKLTANVIFYNTNIYTINPTQSIVLYNKYYSTCDKCIEGKFQKIMTFLFGSNENKITSLYDVHYTGDYEPGNKFIVITNRYSSTSWLYTTVLNEFDWIDDQQFINYYYQPYENMFFEGIDEYNKQHK